MNPIVEFLTVAVIGFMLCLRGVLAQTLQAPAWPLAVKNPYVNTWYRAGPNPGPINGEWPKWWNPSEATSGWYCSILVDGLPYRLMGSSDHPNIPLSNQTAVQITPSRTTVEMQAGPVNVTLNFLSPITATDLMRQSLPFSYFYVTIGSADGLPHAVTLYSDITAEWITGDTDLIASVPETTTDDIVNLQISLQNPQPFVEVNDHAQDSTSFYAHPKLNSSGVKYQVGSVNDVRFLAANSTGLQNTVDPNVSAHPINNPHDVSGISIDLGNVITSTPPLVWALGVTREPSIQFTKLSGEIQLRSSYYRTNFSTGHDIASFLLDDFQNALNISRQFDDQIMNDAQNISSEYSDLLSLITRQAMGALEITISRNPVDGSFNTSDIMAFMKDMGDVGGGGVNAVDVLYSAFPMYIYLNPDIGGHLLKPLLETQNLPLYAQPYAAQDLGPSFPNASLQNAQHNCGIEESGNMIIMVLAHLQATGDDSLVSQYYNLLKHWGDYLAVHAINPGAQQGSPSDKITIPDQTNIALKGIIGIGAMAKLSNFMGLDGDASKYQKSAASYIEEWESKATSPDKSKMFSSLSQSGSAGLMYNLYADLLLQLDLVPPSVYDVHTTYLESQLATSNYGIALQSENPNLSRADWMMFAAASSTNETLRNSLISMVHSYVFTPQKSTPSGPIYDPTSGEPLGGSNSPTMGSLFAVLALNKSLRTKITSPIVPPLNSKVRTIAIAIGVSAGVLALILFVWIARVCIRRRSHKGVSGQGNTLSSYNHTIFRREIPENTIHPFIVPPYSLYAASIGSSRRSDKYSGRAERAETLTPPPSDEDEGCVSRSDVAPWHFREENILPVTAPPSYTAG